MSGESFQFALVELILSKFLFLVFIYLPLLQSPPSLIFALLYWYIWQFFSEVLYLSEHSVIFMLKTVVYLANMLHLTIVK